MATEYAGPGNPNLSLWVVENIFYYVPDTKFLRGNLGFMAISRRSPSGSLVLNDLGITASASWGPQMPGSSTLYLGLPIPLKRVDLWIGDAFMVPIGRYSPGAKNNIGTGYFGNHFTTGTTLYLTKNKGTSASIFTDWEVHGNRQGTNNTFKSPGQAFTDEWGFGQVLPLSKDMSKLIQLGVVGYDQWQVTANGGDIARLPDGTLVPARGLPFYSVHAVGGEASFILPKKNFVLFFKYYDEYKAYSSPIGNTVVFGGTWTLKIPKG